MSDEPEVRPGFLPPKPPPDPPARDRAPAPGGWMPPAPPGGPATPAPARRDAPPGGRPTFVTGRETPTGPSSPLAVMAIVLAAVSIALLIFSVGVAFLFSAILAGLAMALALSVRRRIRAGAPGRPGQARTAIVAATVALALALVAAVVWTVLQASGFGPEDLERLLRDELERRREGASPGDPA